MAHSQDVSVTRLPVDTDMTVRLLNLTSHVTYDRSGNSYFIIPVGRYSVQLLRNGEVAYQEVEYIDADAPRTRTVNPKRMEIVIGLPDGGPQFDPTVCGALETAARLAIRTYGLRDSDLLRRLNTAEINSNNGACASSEDIDDVGQTVAGSRRTVGRVHAARIAAPAAKPGQLPHLPRSVDATARDNSATKNRSHPLAHHRSPERDVGRSL
jgi:hypothetical protein